MITQMRSGDEADRTGGVKTTRTVFEIVEYMNTQNGVSISELSRELGYAKSTIHRHLKTLEEMGYIVEEADGFHVGLRFLELGQRARSRRKGYELAREKVREIANQTGERAQYLVEEHGQAVYLHRYRGEHAVLTDPGIGSRIPLHATAAGKAILSFMDESKRFDIIEHTSFDPITPHTITGPDELRRELQTIRDRGYSFNRQENLVGLHAVGVPVTNADGVLGALSVSGPTHRLKGERFEKTLPNLLLGAANELELNIAHS